MNKMKACKCDGLPRNNCPLHAKDSKDDCGFCEWCKKGQPCVKKIQDEILNIELFTEKYWWPALKDAQESYEITPTAAAIIEDIIKTRSNYVYKLKLKYGLIGGHSVDANGNCNMGCC